MNYNNIEASNICTSKDFYRTHKTQLREEGCDLISREYFLTDSISNSESIFVNNAFYGDNCDYVYSDWN